MGAALSTHRLTLFTTVCCATAGLVLFVSLLGFYLLGPSFETAVFPVFREVMVTRLDGPAPKFIASGVKNRQCGFVEYSALSLIDGSWHQATITRDKKIPTITSPAGHQIFGVFSVVPLGEKVIIEARHECHNLWQTVTRLGEVENK